MADLEITYKGSKIVELSATGSKTLLTAGKYCEDDIEVEYTKSGGTTLIPEVYIGVNFIDYDGTVIATWNINEVAGKTELPQQPTHAGLINDGWNWTLEEIQDYVSDVPDVQMFVGATYRVDNGSTKLFVTITDFAKSPCVSFGANGDYTIDWGDETTTTGTGSGRVDNRHTYSSDGNYVITITSQSKISTSYKANCGSLLYWDGIDDTNNSPLSQVLRQGITEIWIGNINMYIGTFLNLLPNLSKILLSTQAYNILTGGNSTFSGCSGQINALVMHRNYLNNDFYVTGNFIFNIISIAGNQTKAPISKILNSICIPKYSSINLYASVEISALRVFLSKNSVATIIYSHAFRLFKKIQKIIIPLNITTIQTGAFYNCVALHEMKFYPQTPPTVTNSDAFYGLPTNCKILVPSGSLSAYTSATNYPSAETYTYEEY